MQKNWYKRAYEYKETMQLTCSPPLFSYARPKSIRAAALIEAIGVRQSY